MGNLGGRIRQRSGCCPPSGFATPGTGARGFYERYQTRDDRDASLPQAFFRILLSLPVAPIAFSGAGPAALSAARSTNAGPAPDWTHHPRKDQRGSEARCFYSAAAAPATPCAGSAVARDTANLPVAGETGDAWPLREKPLRLLDEPRAAPAPVAANRRPRDSPAARSRPLSPDPIEPEPSDKMLLRGDTSVPFATSFALIWRKTWL